MPSWYILNESLVFLSSPLVIRVWVYWLLPLVRSIFAKVQFGSKQVFYAWYGVIAAFPFKYTTLPLLKRQEVCFIITRPTAGLGILLALLTTPD